MATTVTQKPSDIVGAYTPMIFVLRESDSANYNANKFRYILKVEINQSDTTNASDWRQIALIKVHKNKSNVGIFDISKLIQPYLETPIQYQVENPSGTFTIQTGAYSGIHYVGKGVPARPFSSNESQFLSYRVTSGFEKSTSADTSPSATMGIAETPQFSIPATVPYTDGLDVNGSNATLNSYKPSSSSKKFLTNSPTVQFVRGGDTPADNVDYGTVAFLMEGGTNWLTSGIDPVVRIYIQYHSADGTSLGTYFFVNELANGGIDDADNCKNSILYFGCGTANLEAQSDNTSARPSENDGWAYYRIWGANAIGGQETQIYYFYKYSSGAQVDDRHMDCDKYGTTRIAWRNRLGAWDYMNFRGKSVESVDIERTEIESVPGTWDSETYSYEVQEAGRKTLYTKAKRKQVLNTDWLNEDEAVWLEECFTSTMVEIVGDTYSIPVIITDKSYTKKTSLNNKVKIQYTINVEYANTIRTNS